MLKVLIVDDDPVIRSGLSKNFDWERDGFEICGTAGDGKAALDMIAQQKPDLVLVDIEMPGMNGLDLLKEISKKGFPAVSVVLSGYDNFQYVRQALRLGAVDYLLKPLHEENAHKLFSEIAERIRKEKNSSETDSSSRLLLKYISDDTLHQTALSYLTGMRSDTDGVRFVLNYLHFPTDVSFCLCLLRFLEEYSVRELKNALFSADDGCSKPLLIPYQSKYILLFPGSRGDAFSYLEDRIYMFPKFQCILSASGTFEELPLLFRRMNGSPVRWFYLPANHILSLPAEPSEHSVSETAPLPSARDLFGLLKESGTTQVLNTVSSYLDSCETGMYDQDVVMIRTAELLAETGRMLSEISPGLLTEGFDSIFFELQNSSDFDAFRNVYLEKFEALISQFENARPEKVRLTEQVKAYLAGHYAENFSLSTVAKLYYVNPAYLSYVFSSSTGTTITTCLREIRLCKAAELLQTTEESINEIGAAVGYGNYQHFCKLFKQKYLITPSDFRNRFRRGR